MSDASETKHVGRWGHSLAIRIPARLARLASLSEGAAIELTVEDNRLADGARRAAIQL